jgi:riboflavin synthase
VQVKVVAVSAPRSDAIPGELRYNPDVFTGLVHSTGTVVETEARPQGRRLTISTSLEARDVEDGASVAVSGVCLTVIGSSSGRFQVDAAFETLSRTTLGGLSADDQVNLEPSLRMGDPLGGHLVTGHVDGLSKLRSSSERGDARELWFDVPEDLMHFVAPKGSVCVDGVSLTVNEVDRAGFMVGIIPHTLHVTTFGKLTPGTRSNLEVDIIARYVARLVEMGGSGAEGGVTLETLVRSGFAPGPDEGAV